MYGKVAGQIHNRTPGYQTKPKYVVPRLLRLLLLLLSLRLEVRNNLFESRDALRLCARANDGGNLVPAVRRRSRHRLQAKLQTLLLARAERQRRGRRRRAGGRRDGGGRGGRSATGLCCYCCCSGLRGDCHNGAARALFVLHLCATAALLLLFPLVGVATAAVLLRLRVPLVLHEQRIV